MSCIHQIWIGSHPIPRIWTQTINDFAKEHNIPYRMWREADLKRELDWDAFPGLWDLYLRTERLSGKSNIARYLMLYQCGGVYIDCDCVIVKPVEFAEFLKENAANAWMAKEALPAVHRRRMTHSKDEHPDLFRRKNIVANSILGAPVEHGFWKHVLEDIISYAAHLEGRGSWRETGPGFLANMVSKYGNSYKTLKVFPMKKFYPVHWIGIKDPEAHLKRPVGESMFFQYGYSTNGFDKILARHTRRKRKRDI